MKIPTPIKFLDASFLFFPSLSFAAKNFYCFNLVQGMREGSRNWLRQKPDNKGVQKGPQRPLGSKGS